MSAPERLTALDFFGYLKWIDGTPLLKHIEPYRRHIFTAALDEMDGDRPRYNLVLSGRAKKNWKSADLVLAALTCLIANNSVGGNQCYILANDEGQAGDDLALAKRLVEINPPLRARTTVKQKSIVRQDGRGFLEILPAKDVAGAHGKTYRFCGFDEIHAYRNWDILEAMQFDPTRTDAIQWITSYASIYHRPGVPLFDLFASGKRGTDPRMLFSWYAADYSTDPAAMELSDPIARANPSRESWQAQDYLEQQQRRLPAHKFRRLHLNLPGLPEGSAYQPEPVMDAVRRGETQRRPEPGVSYVAFVDMSGGSSDDAALAIGHMDAAGDVIADAVLNQGPQPPFDPRLAVARFAGVLREYGVSRVMGDSYAGETFKSDFRGHGIEYDVCPLSATGLYEGLEPLLNSRRISYPDVGVAEQQLLGLIWRGGRIDHPSGEHDDWANAIAGVAHAAQSGTRQPRLWMAGEASGIPRGSEVESSLRRQGWWWPGEGA